MLISRFEKRQAKEDLEDFAYRYLIHMMVENKLRPGESILETELATTLKISRTPIRQALSRLVAEGLLEKKRKKGCLLPLPDPQDAREVFHTREVLECDVVKLACLNADPEDIMELNQILKEEREALASYNKENYFLANEKFHFGLMNSAHNAYIERYCRHIFRRSSIYIFFFDSFYSQNPKEPPSNLLSPIQHANILQAIENKDVKTAEDEMKKHIQLSYKVFLGLEKISNYPVES